MPDEHAAISRDEVAHLARLSRLALRDDELDHLATQLDDILSAVARIQEVAAEDIPPTSHALPLTNIFRADEVRPPLGADTIAILHRIGLIDGEIDALKAAVAI